MISLTQHLVQHLWLGVISFVVAFIFVFTLYGLVWITSRAFYSGKLSAIRHVFIRRRKP